MYNTPFSETLCRSSDLYTGFPFMRIIRVYPPVNWSSPTSSSNSDVHAVGATVGCWVGANVGGGVGAFVVGCAVGTTVGADDGNAFEAPPKYLRQNICACILEGTVNSNKYERGRSSPHPRHQATNSSDKPPEPLSASTFR